MTLKGLLSLMRSHKRSESPEQGLLISRRLKELLASTELRPLSTSARNDVASLNEYGYPEYSVRVVTMD